MPKTTTDKSTQTPTEVHTETLNLEPKTYSIAFLADHFMRSEGWVCLRKDFLKEVYPSEVDLMFVESGSLTELGFERIKDVFDKTANIEIKTVNNKRKAVRKTPLMTLQEYKSLVWQRLGRTPVVQEPEPAMVPLSEVHSEGGLTVPVEVMPTEDPTRKMQIMFLEERATADPASEIAESTHEIIRVNNQAAANNLVQLVKKVEQDAQVLGETLKQIVVKEVSSALADAIATSVNKGLNIEAPKPIEVEQQPV